MDANVWVSWQASRSFTTWFVVNETCTICNQIDDAPNDAGSTFSICCINIVVETGRRGEGCDTEEAAWKQRARILVAAQWRQRKRDGEGREGFLLYRGRNERVKNRAKNNGNAVSLGSALSDATKRKNLSKRRKNDAESGAWWSRDD